MGLFNFNRRKLTEVKPNGHDILTDTPEMPRELFIDDSEPVINLTQPAIESKQPAGMEQIYNYLQADYDSRGYGDALVCSDFSYMEESISLLLQGLMIRLEQARVYYEGYLNKIDLQIKSRARFGMVDIVDELETKKDEVIDQLKRIGEVEDQAVSRTGLPESIILSYQKGFKRGLTALTYNSILIKNI